MNSILTLDKATDYLDSTLYSHSWHRIQRPKTDAQLDS